MNKRIVYNEIIKDSISLFLFALLIYALVLIYISVPVMAGETKYDDDSKKNLDDPDVTYTIVGSGKERVNGNYFTVPKNKSSESEPIVIILDNVNRSQVDKSPDKSFITIEEGNYVIIKLRGKNIIRAGEDKQVGSNDGMAALHVAKGSTMKVTSEEGDGSESGSLEAYGGGGKYGGAGIGTRYNDDTGTIIIAGGTIKATGGHSAAGIGSGRDGAAKRIMITGGNITAQGGDYGAGIGAGDNVDTGKGGDLYDLSITGGTVNAAGGKSGAGIGGSEGGSLRGQLLISGGTVTAQGGDQASGIGCGEGGGLSTDDGEKGSVSITGGRITATGGSDGAGVGGGDHSENLVVSINQNSGTELDITANGGKYGAGIGMGDGEADLVDITLRGGTIHAQGGEHGAGIGAGDSIDKIRIGGSGTITAKGGSGAAGIGAGYDHEVNDSIDIQGDSNGKGDRRLTITADGAGIAAGIGSGSEDCGPITIKNATVTAYGDGNAADIGTGGNFGNGGTISNIEIENCRIDTKGSNKYGAGIGAGAGCECKKISIKDSECYGNSIGGGMGVFFEFWANLGDMDSIAIENSTIEATWDRAGGSEDMKGSAAAGIGTSTLGSIKEISIKNSTVTAKGINGGAGIGTGGWGADNLLGLEYVGGEARNIKIENSIVTATGAEPGITTNTTAGPDLTKRPVIGGGAGIGGGGNTNCQIISIDNSTVTAKAGKYAAGIGGGGSESIDSVSITNSTVQAAGGEYGAGIGSGGSNNSTTEIVFHADVDTIYIEQSEVTTQGGDYAAGIGAGCGAAMDTTTADNKAIDNNIHIKDSKVTSTGGKGGAGIGGGTVGVFTHGGHSGNILLEGKSQITATGGRQGSGVGGGAGSTYQNQGGADKILIDLTGCADTAKGPEAIGDKGGWLIARGGKGGAGIGAGGYLFHKSGSVPKTNDTQYVEIRGGYVMAAGGADDTDDSGANTGSGAGIGGGAAGTRLKTLLVNGGWIEASAGDQHASAIGHGGAGNGQDGTDDAGNSYYVADGTVIAESFGPQARKVFDGGSILANVNEAHNSDDSPIYQTKVKMLSSKKEGVLIKPEARADYGTDSIYADEGGYVYLYLPASQEMQQTALVTESVNTDNSAERKYYGTTFTDGTGWLKMEGEQVSFKDPGDINYEEEFTLELDDQHMPSGAKWEDITVSGAAELRSVLSDTSPGMSIVLAATGAGAYTVTARSHDGVENELYWNETINASFTGNTSKANPSPVESGEVSLAKLTSKGKNGLILTWTKVSGAEGYDIFFGRCRHGRKEKKMKLVKTVKAGAALVWKKKGLKKHTSYYACVKAYVTRDGKKEYVQTSPKVHAYTSGYKGKYTNPKSVKLKKTAISLKTGTSSVIKAKVTRLKRGKKLMPADHERKLRYLSSNKKVAAVSRSGRITAKGKGRCKIYVIAVNGAKATVTVTTQ